MILLVGFYVEPELARRAEFRQCLERNLANEHLEEVHLFVEEPVGAGLLLAQDLLPAHPKLRLHDHGRRLTFRDLFDHANRLPGRTIVIANADIYFDETLALLADRALEGRLLCLSRWDRRADGALRLHDHSLSQDAWIFQAPMRPLACDFSLGVPACDNRLAFEAARAGLALSNPCHDIRAIHLHTSGVRRYRRSQRLRGPTRRVPPGHLVPASA
jgi:hypothetical protein